MTDAQEPVQTPANEQGATTRVVLTGAYSDGSGFSEVVYGPYSPERGEELARELTLNGWMMVRWTPTPLGRLPGEPAPRPTPAYRHPFDDPEVQPLFQVLDQRQGGEDG